MHEFVAYRQAAWRDQRSHVARLFIKDETAADRKVELDKILDPQAHVAMYHQENFQALNETLEHELRCIVDLWWLVAQDGYKLIVPDGSASASGATPVKPLPAQTKHFAKKYTL